MITTYIELLIRALLSNKLMTFYVLFILSSSIYGCLKKTSMMKREREGVLIRFIDNVSGDILEVEDMHARRLSVRLDGVVLPRIDSSDECQMKVALVLQNKVAGLLSSAKTIRLNSIDSRLINGRIVTYGNITYDGQDLRMALFDLKLGLHRNSTITNWCTILDNYSKE